MTELGVGYNVCKLEPKSRSHQFSCFLDGLPTFGYFSVVHLQIYEQMIEVIPTM